MLIGKVAMENGAASTDSATIVLECAGQTRAHTYSDREGSFSLSIDIVSDIPVTAHFQRETGVVSEQEWANCELYADLSGYSSERVHSFGSRDRAIVEVGTIVLHRLAQDQDHSFAVSVTSLAAPDKARKAFDKGREQEQKGKWAAACDYFKRAVAEYPRYALAWMELGRAQVKQNSFAEAQQSFRQAVTQDAKLTDGYAELAWLALQQQQWQELADITDRLLQISPDSSPEYWFLNSAANFNLGNMKQAETSMGHGLRLDPKHQISQMEYLYGLILARRQDYKSAAEHVSAYLRLSPHAKDAETAQKALDDFEKWAQFAKE
jgi:lipoprotein NlpI